MLSELERKKMRDEFLIRFGGAFLGMAEDSGLEGYWKATNVTGFPYVSVSDKLPNVDDLIVGGLAIPPWVIGELMKEDGKRRGDARAREMGENLEKVGEGNIIYAFNMLIDATIQRLPEPKWWEPATRVTAIRGASPAGAPRTDVGHRVIKL